MPQAAGPQSRSLKLRSKDFASSDEMVALAYAELRAMARRRMAGERKGHLLQATALVHEAFLRLRELNRIAWRSRTHFLAAAAGQMRRILVEHARRAATGKRGGGLARVTLAEHHGCGFGPSLDMIALDRSLHLLAASHARPARVAEMRLFAGMEVEEIARALEVSGRTVKGDWRFARAWLARDLGSRRGGE